MIDKRGRQYHPICDGCGEELTVEDTWQEAKDAMQAAGWSYSKIFESNLCPGCQEELNDYSN